MGLYPVEKNVVEETGEKVGTFKCETFHQANTVTCRNAVFHSEAFLSQDRDHLDLSVPSVLLLFLSASVSLLLFLLTHFFQGIQGRPQLATL